MSPTITTVKPREPYVGELWFDSRALKIKVYDGTEWVVSYLDDQLLDFDMLNLPIDIKTKLGKIV